MKKYDCIVLLGPTGSGKTDLSLQIAHQINGEIINADAYQVYKNMDIGTGKIKHNQMQNINHHLFDIVDYDQAFDVNMYQTLARNCVDEIINKGKVPIIVGGSNLYVDSIIYDYEFLTHPDFFKVKAEFETYDLATLQKYIHDANIKLNNSEFNNHKRLVNIATKIKLNLDLTANNKQLVYQPLFIKIETDRDSLYKNINQRVDQMFDDGLVNEVRQFKSNYNSQQAIGYKEVHQYLNQELDLDSCIELVKQKSRNYAKRQITWIKHYPSDIVVKREGNIWKKIN